MSIGGIGGIGPSVRALDYWEKRQQVVSNNLANVSTPGFKGERVFAELLPDGGPGAVAKNDFSPGALTDTGRPLDVGMQSEGFLVVRTPQGDRYQRGGSLQLDDSGTLVTEAGYPVLGRNGPIVLPQGKVVIGDDGAISVDGTAIDQLKVELPSAPPKREAGGLWIPQGKGQDVPTDQIHVRQGHLEESNVDPVSAMVDMIDIQRAYTAVQKSIQTSDAVMQIVAGQIGRVSG